ncbi:hypothetical protein DPMN_179190 [Dreissena polymorpha]|uniref:Uncharacterized protein n=1 Tax=Dreissena polymorpha TaxID=45954 RepID=A0A9D4IM44_DREPO|nr:hypothetical protein DPMN_179190 [Dreissena polymorpha]
MHRQLLCRIPMFASVCRVLRASKVLGGAVPLRGERSVYPRRLEVRRTQGLSPGR